MNGRVLLDDGSLLLAVGVAVVVVLLEAIVAVWLGVVTVLERVWLELPPPDPPPLVAGGLQFASGSTY